MDISQMHITEQCSAEWNWSIKINDISSWQLSSLTIWWWCSWMPPWYKQLWAVGNIASSSKINLALYPHDWDIIEVKFRSNIWSFYLLQARQWTSWTIYWLWWAAGWLTLSWYFCWTTLTSDIVRVTWHDYIIRLSAVNWTLTLYVEDLTAWTNDTKTWTYTWSTYNTSYYLWWSASNTYAYRSWVYYAKITNWTSTRMYYVPVDYNWDKWFYDFTSKSFKTNTNGQALTTYITPADTSVIVPNANLPIDITCNNGVIKYRNKSWLPSWYLKLDYIQGGNWSYIDTWIIPSCDVLHVKWKWQLLWSTYWGSFMGCSAGTTPRYWFRIFSNANNWQITLQSKNSLVGVDWWFDLSTVDVTYNNTNGNITWTINSDSVTQTGADINTTLNKNMLLFSAYVWDNIWTSWENKCWYLQIEKDWVIVADLIPAKRVSDSAFWMYDLVSDTFLENQGTWSFTWWNIDYTDAEYYCDWIPETITDELWNTANVENLLQVKNNTFTWIDTQDILSWEIHRNVWVKILRSSDVIEYQSTNSRFVLSAWAKQNLWTRVTPLFCTHFRTIDDWTALANVPNMSIYWAWTTPNLYIHYTSYTTKSSFWNWLESQYTNWTPVIVVYPLDVPTTETVSPQSLSLIGWDNTIARSGNNILKLPISWEYIWVLQREEYSVLRWPCPYWFHIPLSSEWVALRTILTSTFSMAQNRITAWNYLKMPTAWHRYNTTAEVNNVGYRGDYWSATPHSNSIYCLTFDDNSFTPQNMDDRSLWNTIRCFKDYPVIPTSSWTTLYDWSSIAANAWVFHNATDWLISISGDWQTWYTIQDKNLWATAVYNYWDTLTDENCWYFYQRGNNYWFPHSWSITTSTIKTDASTYWPWNYYSSNIFIKVTSTASSQSDWSSVKNNNLWWYESYLEQDNDIYIWEWEWENYYYQWWPCSDWFHVPTAGEWQWLVSIMNTMNFRDWYDFAVKLHLPPMWHRFRDWSISRWWTIWLYRTVTPYENIPYEVIILRAQFSLDAEARWSAARNGALPVRGFSNEYVQPQSDWTVIHWTLWSAWIFWDQTNWFISVTDWTNWYTISDKNCWATTVYNYWDTMSENNCWCYYQRWNNYWFPFDWTIPNISTSKVDTTWNWPTDPYYSSTYINADLNWSTTNNNDLRWYKYVEKYDHLELYDWDSDIAEAFVWDKLIWVNYDPITPEAWVYWCPTKWLISISSDWINWTTISDRDIWANSPWWQWLLYQRWNCYWFPASWSINVDDNTVNTAGYWPWNYYYSNTFIYGWSYWAYPWTIHDDLWWWVTWTNDATRWPCWEWRHIPSRSEWLYTITTYNLIANPNTLRETLKMWTWQYRNGYWLNGEWESTCCLYNKRCNDTDSWSSRDWYIIKNTNNWCIVDSIENIYWLPIRPFRNNPVIPDDTSRIKLA